MTEIMIEEKSGVFFVKVPLGEKTDFFISEGVKKIWVDTVTENSVKVRVELQKLAEVLQTFFTLNSSSEIVILEDERTNHSKDESFRLSKDGVGRYKIVSLPENGELYSPFLWSFFKLE